MIILIRIPSILAERRKIDVAIAFYYPIILTTFVVTIIMLFITKRFLTPA